MNDLKEKLKRIAELTCNDIGKSEENVKQKIVVPLLECLGHHRNQLELEYGTGGKRTDWYDKHTELEKGDTLIIEVIEPKKIYRLSISK
ncbi:MAG: hypothetical protein A2W17_09235 [Planctomycetes bacterium RBG_16_41_13]|nr:MAG: hypothetical protein A2W17_09235 [Planctomycetes bacterium RBG_16_41_13]